MEIKIKDSNHQYSLFIRYYHRVYKDSVTYKTFSTLDSFGKFMDEEHPDVGYDNLSTTYAKKAELLTKLALVGTYEPEYLSTAINCFISGDSLIVSTSQAGIEEKMYEHFTVSEKVNEDYIKTIICHNWSFDDKNTGYCQVKYWYDKNDTSAKKLKIHCFKNKIILEGTSRESIIVTDKYWINYAGAKRTQ